MIHEMNKCRKRECAKEGYTKLLDGYDFCKIIHLLNPDQVKEEIPNCLERECLREGPLDVVIPKEKKYWTLNPFDFFRRTEGIWNTFFFNLLFWFFVFAYLYIILYVL